MPTHVWNEKALRPVETLRRRPPRPRVVAHAITAITIDERIARIAHTLHDIGLVGHAFVSAHCGHGPPHALAAGSGLITA